MARKQRVFVEPKKNPTAFLFTSLMLILLTFFIVLTSMGVQDEKKQKLALNSLMGSFGILPGGSSPYTEPGGKDLLPQSAPLRQEPMGIRKIRATLNEKGIINGIGVSEGAIGVTIVLKSNILFNPGSEEVAQRSQYILDSLAEVLSVVDNHIIITGHSDSVPYESGPYYSNWGLSAARALSVLNYLREKGVPSDRLSAYGMSSMRPITSNSTAEGRALNRRVEITFVGDLPGDIDLRKLDQEQDEPVKTFQYKGYKFRLEEQ